MRDMLSCHGISGPPPLFPVPRYETFRNEKFFRILEGEKAKTERTKNLIQVHQISNFKDSRDSRIGGLVFPRGAVALGAEWGILWGIFTHR